uniref:Putative epidermal growth factor receptor substrate 15-like n=1 Tax=Davidia involucrata TaxID=16924 RepID=A0A5B6ZGV2_DAVIN
MAGQNQTQNMDLFDVYFRRADLDHDGRISGVEAVAFFQGSNLSKQVLAQIWMHADQNKTGFLGRAEFYNALKLVTVSQSKRELTPNMVKAALYGPASAQIPAPQINLTAMPAYQSNPTAGIHAPQLVSAAPTSSQNIGIRGPQVSANTSMDQQSLPSQQNQFMKPPRPMPPGTAFRPQQGVASQGMPGGGSVAASHPLSSNISADWLGGRTGGTPAVVTSQVPNRGRTVSTTQDGFGLAAPGLTPSTQPRPQATTGLTQSAAPKPHDPTLPSNQVVTGNGFASDSVFGDVFSATSSQPKHDSLAPTSSASGLPVSSAIVPASGSQPTAKPSPLGSSQRAFTQQPMGNRHQQVLSTVKQNQQVSANRSTSFTSTGFPVGVGNSVSGQSQHSWPRMTQTDVQKYTKVFMEVDTDRDGKITGEQARNLFLSWRLPREVLKQVWDLSDQDNDSMLSLREFCIALYLMERHREGRLLPTVLPSSIMFDESQLPATGQRAPAYGNEIWGSSPGLQQPKGVSGARPVTPAAGVRPLSQVSVPQADESMQPSQQKPRVPVLEKHLLDQLSKEEQDALNSKFQEATEADKKVEELEKEILDSKEKIEFCRTKMQELIFYKSRCDNRLNEITERASADKREVELLAKKYEEKYKQVGDVASKLTIEEATFRDIQAEKMELYKAIVKMEQDGGADEIQARADRIQLDLEELVKSLNDRCKNYGLRAKPTALVELPFGWQPGIQEGSADWNEDWDKFEDEGFTLVKELTLDVQNVIAPPKPKSSLVSNKASSTDEGVSAVSSSNADGKSEKLSSPRKGIPEDKSTDAQSEEGTSRTPPDSPAERNVLESPSKRYQDSQPRKDIGADGSPYDDSPRAVETQSEYGGAESVLSGDKTFDEPSWGAFDTHYDTDSVWDFNPVTTKDMDHEKHSESSFFNPGDWGLNPIRTQSTDRDSIFQKNTYAFADSVPSTPMSIYGNSPHVDNMFQKRSPFAFADSVPSTPMFNSGNSPRRFSEGLEDHSFDNFSRFDSFSTHDSRLFPPQESLTRFDSIQSTRDSDYGHGFFAQPDSLSRFDSFRSTRDSDSGHGFFPAPDSLTRFDSIRSTRDADYSHEFPSFDDTDPFGSSGPFKTSLESQTPRRDSDIWRAF